MAPFITPIKRQVETAEILAVHKGGDLYVSLVLPGTNSSYESKVTETHVDRHAALESSISN